ncbi:MAG: tetratricopeptide repeat protein [Candidatus Acidiferrum sp.]|jgi:tetratricopeptide (TPR) repeat protein
MGNLSYAASTVVQRIYSEVARRLRDISRYIGAVRGRIGVPERVLRCCRGLLDALQGRRELRGRRAFLSRGSRVRRAPSNVLVAAGLGVAMLAATGELARAGQPQTTPERIDPQEWFAQGQAALQSGDLATAEKSFRKVLSVDPRSAAAYANLGVIAMRRKDWEQALSLLQKAEKLDPKMAGIRLNIGLVEYRRANYPGAIAPLTSVVREQPENAQARYLLGLCQVFTERYTDAVATLEPLWQERSGDVMYLYVLGIAAHNAEKNPLNEALDERALKELIEVGGDSPELHFILGKAYLNRQDDNTAIAELNRAVAGNPNLPYVHFTLGITHMRLGDNDALAEEEFRKDIAIEPDLTDNYEQLGVLYAREQKPDEAEKALAEALRRDPKMASAHFGLAQLYFDQAKFTPALREVDAALVQAPASQNAHYLRGRILTRLGRQEDAKAELAATQKLMNQSLGKARADLGDKSIPNPELTHEPN